MNYAKTLLVACCLCAVVVSGCGGPADQVSPTAESVATAIPSVVEPTQPPATAIPTAAPQAAQLWACYGCGGDSLWQLDSAGSRLLGLPTSMGAFYDFSADTGQVLCAAKFGDHGAGPGNVSVSDLSVIDLASGSVTEILPDNVVEAAWVPGGQAIAYILATPSTYELRVRDSSGGDRLLASDVSFTWSVAPSGEAIAFTRESGYELQAAPGLFVVTVADGHEIALSDADKGGTGSISDRPMWSLDSREVIFSLWGGPDNRLVLARADGSDVFDLSVGAASADAWWSELQVTSMLWFPDGDHVLVNTNAISPETGAGGMGGPTALVVYRIDRTQHTLVDGRLLGMTMGLIDWDVPGETVWSIGDSGQPEALAVSEGS